MRPSNVYIRRFPGATVKRYRKATFSRRAGKDLIARITAECDMVVGALAD